MSDRNRFNVLDPLRLLAALSVLAYHYSIYLNKDEVPLIVHATSFGYLGVQFFFMLSGFVIMASAQNRGAAEFIISRAARLYPAFWICLGLTILTIFTFKIERINFTDALANATILNDYIGIENIDGVYWTLQAEIKFYGCIFLLLFLGLFKYTKIWLSLWMILTAAYYFFGQPSFMSWFISPGYSSYFIGGICAYLLYKNHRDGLVIVLMIISLAFSVLQATKGIYQFFPSANQVDVYVAAFVVLLFYAFFTLLSFGYFDVRQHSFFTILGAVSYPLYLLHNRAGKAVIEELLPYYNVYVVLLIVTVAVIFLSAVIARYIEKEISLRISRVGERLTNQIRFISKAR